MTESENQLSMAPETTHANCLGWAARDPSGVLSPYEFNRRAVAADDVSIKITHCGVCYADVVWTKNLHRDSKYPVVPGHEIVGIVKEVGQNVDRFKVGDHVGVGTYVNSCRDCEYCNEGMEVNCVKGSVFTFNGVDADGTVTKGGYSSSIVVHERYCYRIPDNLPSHLAAPLLCAGITVYSPMIRHNMNQPGKSLGVVGLGVLDIWPLSLALTGSLDFIVDTASGDHQFEPYLWLLKTFGAYVLVGFPSEVKFSPASLLLGMKTFSGSITGGTKVTQEMLEFCAANKVYPNVEVVPIEYANEAIERLIKRDVKYRFVIDIENSLK
uniref:Enoyl reductase (ER) domain-containing protein n=1 Tax=Chenopodium quinoa TaxID=63459 RepID=A0A803NDN7_CHEQI